MATDQNKITFYVAPDEREQFQAIIKAEDKTMTAVLRRFVRGYIATNGFTQDDPVEAGQ